MVEEGALLATPSQWGMVTPLDSKASESILEGGMEGGERKTDKLTV